MLSNWLSFETLKWLLTTLAIPLSLGVVSYQYQSAQTERQVTDARLRLYTELLSKREEADTGVRKGIFDRVLETYLKPETQDLESKIVALELLAVNFNDSLDLSPLFWQISREIQQPEQKGKRPFLTTQLDRITNDVKDRQIEVLESVGASTDVEINLDRLQNDSGKAIDTDLSFLDTDPAAPKDQKLTRHFTVEVAEYEPAGRRVWVFVTHRARPLDECGRKTWRIFSVSCVEGKEILSGFWVDVFDFPLTNFTRTSKSERFTVVLRRYKPPTANLTIIYFPSSRSGVKDKPFIDEVISNLRATTR
jgi:hypothetical protein